MSSSIMRVRHPEWTSIGLGVEIRDFCDAAGRRIGIFERHQNDAGLMCQGGAILFDGNEFGDYPKWEAEQYNPLTIKTQIRCARCGHSGWINHGKWETWK